MPSNINQVGTGVVLSLEAYQWLVGLRDALSSGGSGVSFDGRRLRVNASGAQRPIVESARDDLFFAKVTVVGTGDPVLYEFEELNKLDLDEAISNAPVDRGSDNIGKATTMPDATLAVDDVCLCYLAYDSKNESDSDNHGKGLTRPILIPVGSGAATFAEVTAVTWNDTTNQGDYTLKDGSFDGTGAWVVGTTTLTTTATNTIEIPNDGSGVEGSSVDLSQTDDTDPNERYFTNIGTFNGIDDIDVTEVRGNPVVQYFIIGGFYFFQYENDTRVSYFFS